MFLDIECAIEAFEIGIEAVCVDGEHFVEVGDFENFEDGARDGSKADLAFAFFDGFVDAEEFGEYGGGKVVHVFEVEKEVDAGVLVDVVDDSVAEFDNVGGAEHAGGEYGAHGNAVVLFEG